MIENIAFEIRWVLQELLRKEGPGVLETPKGKALVRNLDILEAARKRARRKDNGYMQQGYLH